MRLTRSRKTSRVLGICLAMLYAFSTRTILYGFLYGTNIQLWVYYSILYICLGVSFLKTFNKTAEHLYVPRGLLGVLSILFVMLYSMNNAENLSSMIYYGIAILLPFAFTSEMKLSKKASKVLVAVGLFFAIGCWINFMFPMLYSTLIYPLFSESAKMSLEQVERLTEKEVYYAGFTSQVGYTSFFLNIALGTLFCFRKSVFKRTYVVIGSILLFALLLTGKRGPFIFGLLALIIIYFAEGKGREKFYRVVKIGLFSITAFLVLTLVAKYTEMEGIQRIYDAVWQLLISGSIEDAGRNQLYEKAIEYFLGNPFWGIGWANFQKMFSLRSTHVHCIYLQLLCETGIIGFTVFLSFFVSRLLATIQKFQRVIADGCSVESSWIELSLFIQIYFLLYGITGNPLYDVEETIIYFFGIGISYLPLLHGVRGQKNENCNINISVCA